MIALLLQTVMIATTTVAATGTSWTSIVHVGTNDTCQGPACNNLTAALTSLLSNNTLLYIEAGTYYLEQASEVRGTHHVAIVGLVDSIGATPIIICRPKTGLSFYNSDDIAIHDITLVGCGVMHNSTSRDYNDVTAFSYVSITTTAHFLLCHDVSVESVEIRESLGSGLVLYNVGGNVTISHSTFTLSSGGGVTIEYTYCTPGDHMCPHYNDSQIDSTLVSNSYYHIHSNTFCDNNAALSAGSTSTDTLHPVSTRGYEYTGLGRGGGLSITFKGNAQDNTVIMTNNTFTNNTAIYGGGLYIHFDDSASNNSLVSKVLNVSKCTGSAEGGGIMVVYGGDDDDNTMCFSQGLALYNTASNNGGALAVHSTGADHTSPSSIGAITFNNFTFESNSAKLGLAVYMIHHSVLSSSSVAAAFVGCRWKENNFNRACVTKVSQSPCSGVLYTSRFPLTLISPSFTHNEATALEAHGVTVTFKEGEAIFEGNIAKHGAAIQILECARIITEANVNFRFTRNVATVAGGAIYVSGCSSSYYSHNNEDCFIQSIDGLHPDKWSSRLYFDSNTAKGTINSIYTDSLMACIWPTISNDLKIIDSTSITNTFCWQTWAHSVDGIQSVDCPQAVVQTGPREIKVNQTQISLTPGLPIQLPITVTDAYGQETLESLTICTLYEKDDGKCVTVDSSVNDELTSFTLPSIGSNITDNCSALYDTPLYLSISTVNVPHVEVQISSIITCCPLGTVLADSQCSIALDKVSGLYCMDSDPFCPLNSSLLIESHYCWNAEPDNSSNTSALSRLQGGSCPYSNQKLSSLPISDLLSHDHTTCPSNREGRLCGRCKDKHGAAIGSDHLDCVSCTGKGKNHGIGWVLYFSIETVFTTVAIVLLIALSISLNAGGTNALIFFSQVVTLHYPGFSYPTWVLDPESTASHSAIVKGFTLPYSLFNLDFLHPLPFDEFCISESVTTTQAIALEYLPVLYPLLLIALIYLWMVLYNIKCNVVYLTSKAAAKHCTKRLKRGPSMMESFATIFVICYTRIASTSLKLLLPTTVYNITGDRQGTVFYYDGTLDYFGRGHIEYATAGVVGLLVLVVLPAVLLLIYPALVKWWRRDKRSRRRLNAIAASFNDCFKDGSKGTYDHRYFAGVYLVLHVAVVCLYLIHHNLRVILVLQTTLSLIVTSIFISVRPYKNNSYNVIDGLLFLYLAFLSSLSSAGYAYVCYKGLLYLPLVLALGYLFLKAGLTMRRWQHTSSHRDPSKYIAISAEDDDIDAEDSRLLPGSDQSPDGSYDTSTMVNERILHPERYDKDDDDDDDAAGGHMYTSSSSRKPVALLDLST